MRIMLRRLSSFEFESRLTTRFRSNMTDKESIQGKIIKIQADLKNFQPSFETKDKKRHLEALINDLASMIEECFEFRQSLKELKEICIDNENQLKVFRHQLKDPQIKQAQKDILTQKLNSQIETGKKNKEIEDEIKNKLRMTNQQLLALRDLLLKMFEDQLSFILRQELKELHLKQENIELQMTSMSLSQESTNKSAQLNEQTNEIKVLKESLDRKEQLIQELKTKIENAEKYQFYTLADAKASNERLYSQKKPLDQSLTPKGITKLRSSNKSTDMKLNTSTRILGQEKSMSPKPVSTFFAKLTSPLPYKNDDQPKLEEVANSRRLWECHSPHSNSSIFRANENGKSMSSVSQNLREKSPNSIVARYGASRYSDAHETSKNKTVVTKIELNDLKVESKVSEISDSKLKNQSFRDKKKSISQCLSNEYDNGSVSTLEINGASKDLNPIDLSESRDVNNGVKVNLNSRISNVMGNYTIINKPGLSAELKPKYELDIKKKGLNSFISRTPILQSKELKRSRDINSNSSSYNKQKILFGSADLKTENDENSKPIQTCPDEISHEDKMSIPSIYHSLNSNAQSTKKITPRDRKIRDITNIYSPGQQYSSNKKDSYRHSQQDSIVRFETSIKKKSVPKVDSYLKNLNSELKNPLDSESEYMKGSQIDSPEPWRINRNLTTILLQDVKKPAFAASEDFFDPND